MVDEVGTNTSEKAASSSDAQAPKAFQKKRQAVQKYRRKVHTRKRSLFLDQTTEDNNGILERTYLFPQVN